MFERICIILLANILFYLKTFNFKYCSDDLTAFQDKKPFKNKWHRLFLQLEGSGKYDVQQDHLITLLFHALTCVFIYITFGKNDISFLASFLFAFNPITNQGSVWMSGRSYVLSALFVLASISFPYLGPILLAGAVYYNIGFFASFIIVFSSAWWLIFFLVPLMAFHFKKMKAHVSSKMDQETVGEDKRIHIGKIVIAIKTFGFYLSHALIPTKTTFYHSFLQSMAGNEMMKKRAYAIEKYFFIGLVSLLAIFIYWIMTPWSMISFALLWWCIYIAPFLNIFRMNQEIAERYAYAPSIGLMYVLAVVIINHPILITFFITMYATRMWFFMECYKDDYFLTEMSCFSSSDSWYVWHTRAWQRFRNGSLREAAILWVMAKMISPKEFKVLVNLATVLKLNNQLKEAEEYLKLAEENIPIGMEEKSLELIRRHRKGECHIIQ